MKVLAPRRLYGLDWVLTMDRFRLSHGMDELVKADDSELIYPLFPSKIDGIWQKTPVATKDANSILQSAFRKLDFDEIERRTSHGAKRAWMLLVGRILNGEQKAITLAHRQKGDTSATRAYDPERQQPVIMMLRDYLARREEELGITGGGQAPHIR